MAVLTANSSTGLFNHKMYTFGFSAHKFMEILWKFYVEKLP